jgi:hypothetical protein
MLQLGDRLAKPWDTLPTTVRLYRVIDPHVWDVGRELMHVLQRPPDLGPIQTADRRKSSRTRPIRSVQGLDRAG